MDVAASMRCDAPPAEVLAVVRDLGRYPEWLQIVTRAEPDEARSGDAGPAWVVDLRGQLGPFRRTKRLRMVRTSASDTGVRFERREVDGRRHASWKMEATVVPHEPGSDLTVRLHYGGSLWVPLLDRLLAEEIRRGRERLGALLAAR